MRKKQKYNFGPNGLPASVKKQRDKMFQQGLLWCTDCEQFKAIKEFYKGQTNGKNYGYRFHCKKCNSARNHKRKAINKVLAKKRNSNLSKTWAEQAGGQCQRCGDDEFYSGLDFHHVYPAEKEYTPSWVIYRSTTTAGYQRCWNELDKCCLLCSKCHNGYEAGLWRAEFIKRDELGYTVGEPLPLNDDRYDKKPEVYEQSEIQFNWNIHQHIKQLSFIE